MKVIHESADRLVLDDRPWLLGGLIAATIVVLAGFALHLLLAGDAGALIPLLAAAAFGLAFAIFVRRSEAVFDRHAGTLTLRERTLRRTAEQFISLNRIRFASVQTRYSRQGKGRRRVPLRRPVLHLKGDPEVLAPLMQTYVAGGGARIAADTINRWMGVPPVPRDDDDDDEEEA